ncbi:MAG: hypothetical protein GY834_07705 [Bacteroidetes bacterium]|nr:hypothetical protein [Bacteroidota bacterium]
MSKDYTSDVKFNINYKNPPPNQIITYVIDSIIYLNLDSRGFDLFNQSYLRNKKSIDINLQSIDIHKNRANTGNYILSSTLLSQIKKQFDFSNQISSISPDTLFLNLESSVSKEVPILLQIEIEPKQQHYIYGSIKQSNTSVIINGPSSIINSIQSIQTEFVKLQDINQSMNIKLALINPFDLSQLNLSNDSVMITIPIEEFTENSINVPIHITDNQDLSLKLFPEEIEITYLVALKDFKNINPSMFNAEIHFNPELIHYQDVLLQHYPPFIKISNFEPKRIEYVILKK